MLRKWIGTGSRKIRESYSASDSRSLHLTGAAGVFCILLAVPGFAGWIAPYFLYRSLVGRKTEKVGPLIEAKYDELYEICEKGSRLLM